jgi:mRNA interferase MazF
VKPAKYHVYWADLNPRYGTEPGKKRPVVVVQTDLLNGIHPSTIICPITTRVIKGASRLRVHLSRKEAGLPQESDILIDQVRAIDNRRFIQEIGEITQAHQRQVVENLQIILFE